INLMTYFIDAVTRESEELTELEFLLVGRKMTCEIDELLDFEEANWEIKLKELVRTHGKYVTYDSDFFVFPRGMYRGVPPFAIGRCFWTQWLMHTARIRGTPVVDA